RSRRRTSRRRWRTREQAPSRRCRRPPPPPLRSQSRAPRVRPHRLQRFGFLVSLCDIGPPLAIPVNGRSVTPQARRAMFVVVAPPPPPPPPRLPRLPLAPLRP